MTAQEAQVRFETECRQLDERYFGKMYVGLFWRVAENEIWLGVCDNDGQIAEGEPVACQVPNEFALDAFWHPIPYILAHLNGDGMSDCPPR